MAKKPFKTDQLAGLEQLEEVKGRSLWQDALRRLMHNKAAVVSMVLLSIIVVLAIFAPYLSPWAFDDPDWGYDFPGPPNASSCTIGSVPTATAGISLSVPCSGLVSP